MKAEDVMTLGAATVRPDASTADAAELMLQYRISGLPVVTDKGNLVGMITERDFLRRSETGTTQRRPRWSELLFLPGVLADDYVRSHSRTVADVMTREVITVSDGTPLDEVVALMERHNVKRLPVLRDGKIVGIVSRANLLRAIARQLGSETFSSESDRMIRDRIIRELRNQPWSPRASIDITVRDGVVKLRGFVSDERLRRGIRVAAETAAGVKAVNGEIEVISPAIGLA
jgi:CBS domain-containing protein